jgi:PRTRC genetic system protein E
MTIFEELFALACSATLTMTVSADEASGRLTINVIPKPRKDADEPALTQPLSLTATPKEFDVGFIDALRGYREVRHSLAQQAEATKEVIEAAKAASVKKASAAATTKTVGAVTARTASASVAAPATAEDDEAGDDTPAPQNAARAAVMGSSGSFSLFG